MGRTMQPLLKRCKALGINPLVMGYEKTSKRNPNANSRKKRSEYGTQLNEKQKVRFIYGVQEKQFENYYVMASKKAGITGEVLLQILESRLDNVVYRLGFAKTRQAARQLVNHGHIKVNGKKVDIPSYLIKTGDVISIKESSRSSGGIKETLEKGVNRTVPGWLELNKEDCSGKVLNLAARSDIDFAVEEHRIVEYYSK
jgi:small subunit ribosomal protein S4